MGSHYSSYIRKFLNSPALAAHTGDVRVGNVSLTVISDLNGPTPQFTLTCISTGGPATTVSWTRDSIAVPEGSETVLDDPKTSQYTHTLTVSGRLPGLYTCTVENNKPSSDYTQIDVEGIQHTTDATHLK